MLFLATFFPMSDVGEEEGGHKFDLLNDFLRATVDMADLVGIYLVMSRVAGRGSVKVLVAGLGWGFAELVLTRLVFLWVGARGVEFGSGDCLLQRSPCFSSSFNASAFKLGSTAPGCGHYQLFGFGQPPALPWSVHLR